MQDTDQIDMQLRVGLRDLPIPAVSPDFDACVLAALQQPRSRWQVLWASARPVLAGAVCSLTTMLALLYWTSQAPIVPGPVSVKSQSRPINTLALERALDRPGLTIGMLERLSADPAMLEEPPARPISPEADRHRGPVRRAGLYQHVPILV